jgi:hypothetical protein
MKTLIVSSIVALVSVSSFAESSKIDLLWKARGLQAVEKIAAIKKSSNEKKNYSKEKKCELALEEYYASFTSPEKAKLLRETNKGSEIYNIVFGNQTPGNKSNLTIVRVVYDSEQSAAPDGIGVVELASSWSFTIFTKYPDAVALRGNGCTFIFPIKDPLSGSSAPIQ